MSIATIVEKVDDLAELHLIINLSEHYCRNITTLDMVDGIFVIFLSSLLIGFIY